MVFCLLLPLLVSMLMSSFLYSIFLLFLLLQNNQVTSYLLLQFSDHINCRCVFCGKSSACLNCCGHNNEKCYQENSRVIDSYPDSSLYFHADCGYSLKVWPKHKLPKFYCKKCKKNIDNDGGNAHICFRCEGIEQLRLCAKHNFGKVRKVLLNLNLITLFLGREPLKVDFQNLKIIPSVDNIVDV